MGPHACLVEICAICSALAGLSVDPMHAWAELLGCRQARALTICPSLPLSFLSDIKALGVDASVRLFASSSGLNGPIPLGAECVALMGAAAPEEEAARAAAEGAAQALEKAASRDLPDLLTSLRTQPQFAGSVAEAAASYREAARKVSCSPLWGVHTLPQPTRLEPGWAQCWAYCCCCVLLAFGGSVALAQAASRVARRCAGRARSSPPCSRPACCPATRSRGARATRAGSRCTSPACCARRPPTGRTARSLRPRTRAAGESTR